MKKRILTIVALQLFLILNSCSSSDKEPVYIVDNEEIETDFIAKNSGDFVITTDDLVYNVSSKPEYVNPFIEQIDAEGKTTVLKTLDFTIPKLVLSQSGELLLISPNKTNDSDKIFRFENNFQQLNPFYVMQAESSPFAKLARLGIICNANDGSYFVFDYTSNNIKRVIPELGTDVFIAGSGKREIKDGDGLEAGFGGITKILFHKNIFYLIDNDYKNNTTSDEISYIRKLEFLNNKWTVTTLISTPGVNVYKDLAFDANNNLHVVVSEKGIYKLNLQNNDLSLYKDGKVKMRKDNRHYYTNFKTVIGLKFKGNVMYLATYDLLIKISDYQSKFDALGK